MNRIYTLVTPMKFQPDIILRMSDLRGFQAMASLASQAESYFQSLHSQNPPDESVPEPGSQGNPIDVDDARYSTVSEVDFTCMVRSLKPRVCVVSS
jgi:hypothetical protein